MEEITPILASMSNIPAGSEPLLSGPSTESPKFDKTKLLIPVAIIIAGILVSGSVLFARLSASIDGAPQQVSQPRERVDIEIGTSPVLGDANAPVTIVEFADFQCPYCERYFQQVENSILKDYVDTGKAKFVWKDYAFLGPESTSSAVAARCAQDQGKFWEYHDYLYGHQGQENSGAFSVPNLKGFAKALNLDTVKFNSCLDSNKYLSSVQNDTKLGSSIGVDGTPATFVNGMLVTVGDRSAGASSYSVFKAEIEKALKK